MNESTPAELPADPPHSVAVAQTPRAGADARESWRSEELLGNKTEVQILHGNEIYRLRRTRQGKLILYK
jgi:hemin uptake protein HemP